MIRARDEQFILRIDANGRVVAMSVRARAVLGKHAVGLPCDLAVGATGPDGQTVCRHACGNELARGHSRSPPERDVVLRGEHFRLRCLRLDNEAVVIADPIAVTDKTEQLTPREREVLTLVAQGLSSPKIAERLGVSAATVRTHVEHARGRLGASTRAEAVLRAVDTGQLRRPFS